MPTVLVASPVRFKQLFALLLAVSFFVGQVSATPTDELLALHEKVMRAHRDSNVELLLEDESEDYVVASRGAITKPSKAERRTRLGAYLGATRFSEYRDLVPPIVTMSVDGTLGWVTVQVQARGTQTTPSGARETIEFVSAWIELYQRRQGRWQRVGNVSNFKE
jgi:hypothetical protein